MWAFSKDGNYLVKTAYMFGKGCNVDDFHKTWVEVWKLDVLPKIRYFLWRACTNTLPVRAALKKRHIIDDAQCPGCLRSDEIQSHALMNCDRIKTFGQFVGVIFWSRIMKV